MFFTAWASQGGIYLFVIGNPTFGVFQANVSRRNDAFDDLAAPVGTYELLSYGGEQVKQLPL